jgi:hypothetical protein
MATIRREMGHFGIFHHICFLARLVRELQREGIRLRAKLRRESEDGHARRRTGFAVDRRIRRLNR